MGMLRILSRGGDSRLSWDVPNAMAGDAEAMAAVLEAECIFARERQRDATAFRVEQGKPIERLERFDPQAEQLIIVPRVIGG